MSQERREQLAQQLTEQLRGLENRQITRIGRIWDAALQQAITRVMGILDGIDEQPWYDPKTTPGAFAGSTPDGPVAITPLQKNQAALYLEGQLIQDLRRALAEVGLTSEQQLRLDQELRRLFNRASDLGTEYATQLSRDGLEPALQAIRRPPGEVEVRQWPDRESERYQEGQRFTRLFDMEGSIAAAERDFRSLSMLYRRQRDIATDAHVAASKHYYFKWWRDWGETVSFVVAREMAAGPDTRRVKRELQERLPNINEAFKNRAETIARTETLMASNEAQERTYRQLRVGFVQYLATLDDRTCEFCAPRHGCLYWIGSVKAPIHPNCRCTITPVTLESLALQNSFAEDSKGTWEAEAQAAAAAVKRHFEEANGEGAQMRPTGGIGEARSTRDLPLMERSGLPQTRRRPGVPRDDPRNAGSRPWPAGEPVWCPRRGWIDPNARLAYESVQAEVRTLGL
jgi:SPP1 gp7 family putative phage head morphogenesis protein